MTTVRRMPRVARRTETTNNVDFWATFWSDPSKLMKSTLESTFSGLFIEQCEKNNFAIRVRVANFNLNGVNKLRKALQAFAKDLTKKAGNPKLYEFEVAAVIQDNSFVKFTLNY